MRTTGATQPGPSVLAELDSLSQRARGRGSIEDFYRVVLAFMYLHRVAPGQLNQLAADSPKHETPDVILQRIARLLHVALSSDRLPTAIVPALTAIHPGSREDVNRLVTLTRDLPTHEFELIVHRLAARSRYVTPLTPPSVADLMARLAVDGQTRPAVVYDPCARAGELLTSVSRHLSKPIEAVADSPAPELLAYAGMNLRWQKMRATTRLDHAPWTRSDRTAFADVALSNPPFNASGGNLHTPTDFSWPFGAPPDNSQNFAWLQHAVASLRPGGRAVVLMPPSTLWSAVPSEATIRQRLIEARTVKCIVTLPKNTFRTTAVAPVAWVLSPPGESGDHVLFIMADELGKRVGQRPMLSTNDLDAIVAAYGQRDRTPTVSPNIPPGLSMAIPMTAIQENRFSLNPGDYRRIMEEQDQGGTVADSLCEGQYDLDMLRNEAAEAAERAHTSSWRTPLTTSSTQLPGSWRRLLLRDICEIQPGPSATRLRANERTPTGTVHVVMPKHLRDGRVHPSDDERVSHDKAKTLSDFRVRAGDIVCVRTGTLGKAAVVHQNQEGSVLHTNLIRLRLRPDTPVDPHYLLAYLSQASTRKWISDRAAAGSPVPSLSSGALGELTIAAPTLDEQAEILDVLYALADQTAAHERLARASADWQSRLTHHLLGGGVVLR
ncbi:N-6 DNA methylase [Hamadaea sp. NPDC051192]|uniref:N-6 DNA methylase n=1 Tax=Hamadaea sp. NPDC051192 TaxID=3154940 RepID=UPI0034203558